MFQIQVWDSVCDVHCLFLSDHTYVVFKYRRVTVWHKHSSERVGTRNRRRSPARGVVLNLGHGGCCNCSCNCCPHVTIWSSEQRDPLRTLPIVCSFHTPQMEHSRLCPRSSNLCDAPVQPRRAMTESSMANDRLPARALINLVGCLDVLVDLFVAA